MRFLYLLCILLVIGGIAKSEVLYPTLLDDQIWVKISGYDDKHILPTPYGTASTNGFTVDVSYAEPFWAEPYNILAIGSITNEFVYTNAYDQIMRVTQITHNNALVPAYDILIDQVSNTVTQEVVPEHIDIADVYQWNLPILGPEHLTRWNRNDYNYRRGSGIDGFENGIYNASRKFEERMFKDYYETNRWDRTDEAILITSFGNYSITSNFHVTWSVDYEFEHIGHATDSFRWAMSGIYLTNVMELVDLENPLTGSWLPSYGSNYVHVGFDATSINALHHIIDEDLGIEDNIRYFHPTNASDYATTGTTYLDTTFGSDPYLVLEDGATCTVTVPAAQVDTNKIYYLNYFASNINVSHNGHTYHTRGEFIHPSGADITITFSTTGDSGDHIWRWYELVEFDEKRMVYSYQDFANGLTFTRNSNCWAYALDLTPFSPWHTTNIRGWPEKTCGAGTLISRDCVLYANHFYPANGEEIHFVTLDNQVVVRTLIDSQFIDDDIRIGRLDSPVPDSISHCHVYPADYERYMPTTFGITAIRMNQMELAMASSHVLQSNGLDYQVIAQSQGHINENVVTLNYKSAWDGDSGGCVSHYILPQGSTNITEALPVALWCHYSPEWGGNACMFFDEINQAMSDMGSVFQLTPVPFQELGYEPLPTVE